MLGGAPEWTDGRSDEYPASRFLVGVGTGPDLDAARNAARAEVSRIFESRIEDAVLDTRQEMTRRDSETGLVSKVVEKVVVETRLETEGEYEGLRIAETWRDPDTQSHYALAVLEKTRAHRSFAERAAERERETAGYLAQAHEAGTHLAEARALVQALRASAERDGLAARAGVVGPALPASDPGTSAVREALDRSLAGVRFDVVARDVRLADGAEGDTLPRLRDRLTQELADMGFQIREGRAAVGNAEANRVVCRVGLAPVERGGSDWSHYRWDGSCEVLEPGAGVLVSSADSGYESHPVAATARTKARDAAERRLVLALRENLRSYLYSEP